jgi:hypothetical protein
MLELFDGKNGKEPPGPAAGRLLNIGGVWESFCRSAGVCRCSRMSPLQTVRHHQNSGTTAAG